MYVRIRPKFAKCKANVMQLRFFNQCKILEIFN